MYIVVSPFFFLFMTSTVMAILSIKENFVSNFFQAASKEFGVLELITVFHSDMNSSQSSFVEKFPLHFDKIFLDICQIQSKCAEKGNVKASARINAKSLSVAISCYS